ncbi:MAG: tetratricopeptide repeat protein [Candidatus Thiodiazotropha sp.]|nr:tetratricopeptide repeat protein [Candidatus Thiodiazotropha sp.]
MIQVLSGLTSRLLLSLSLASPLCATAEIRTGEPQELRDLHYGEALYQLYQQNYFPAIVRLLSARKQGLMEAYEDEPELLLGGLYLAYGMPNTAESLFNQVLKQSASPKVQRRAWLQLGKSRHRRGNTQAAKSALKQVGNDLESEMSDEKHHLTGLIGLIQKNEPEALSDLSKISQQSEWSLYGRFNLAIAHLRSNQLEKGLALLQEIGNGSKETDDAEAKSIRDRANLARGFLLLETQQAGDARNSLQRVRLKSPSSSQALLGLGWASLQLGDQEQALPPWQLLAERNTSDPAVLEAKLAIPYVLSLLQADRQSLEAYRDAIDTYDSSIQQLDRMLQEVTKGDFPNSLLGDLDPTSTTRIAESELRSLLSYLLSGNAFQERLQDYRDLLAIESNLQQWQQKITSYRTMLANQRDAYKQKEPRVDAHLQGQSLDQVVTEKDRLKALYKQAESTEEPLFALANQQEKGWIERIKRINRLITKHNARGQLSTQVEMARLMEGILTWRMATEHPSRIRALKKQMTELEQNIELAHQKESKLAEARSSAEGRFDSFSKRIKQREREIPMLQRQLKKLRQSEASVLQEIALSQLEKRRSLINNYLIQARFGVANLMDLSAARDGGQE